MTERERWRRLEAVCLQDMAGLAGQGGSPSGRLLLRLVLGGRVRRFARDMARFDAAVGHVGAADAAGLLARRLRARIVAADPHRVSSSGPVLLVANHPGLLDALAVYATAPRSDLVALARSKPLLGLLPEMTRHLLIMPDDADRVGPARALLRYLGDGGAALLFPAGRLEPEPTHVLEDEEPLGDWSPGLGTLVRLAARRGIPLRIVPTAVSGVLSDRARRRFGPLIALRRTPRARADLAALLQLAFPRLAPTTIRVRYGDPIEASVLAVSGLDPAELTARIRDDLCELLDPPRPRLPRRRPDLTPALRPVV